ncbi:MAG: sulfatase-like hydrolase/transferase [Verrucomicrobiota bacterium]|nr:sulfatase-like hydrolase/transferase [Verrucomicrobiota bacterium]MDP7049178.1 sulfatase-like hydrolase/transferase [Verrucomicrobiota bacterium]
MSFFRKIGQGSLLLAALGMSQVRAEQTLPNILWITSEDNGPHLGCYGDSYAVTPNLDRLAKRSIRYTKASSTAPVCAPARTTIISGIYPPATGAEHMRSMTRLPAEFKMYPAYLRELGYYCTNNSKEDYNLEKVGPVWNESGRKAHWKNRPDGKPFFAIFNHTISHESQIRNKINATDRIHDPAMVRLPAYHPDTPEVRKDWAQYYDRITMMDKLVGKNLREIEESGLTNDTIVFYYGDHGSGMPRSKRWPYFSGLNVPLIVHVPEKFKHLAPPEYKTGGSTDRLVGFIDLAPTLLSIAGVKPPEHMQGHAFMGQHTAPAQKFSYGFRGRMDERYDMVRTVFDGRHVYIRNYMPHKPYGQYLDYMFQTPTTRVWRDLFRAGKLNAAQSVFWQTKPAEELYDLEADPDEVRNLAKSKEHAAILKRLRKAHRNWAKDVRDIGFLPEAEIHSRAGDASPYEMGHDDSRYDFDAIFLAANAASSKGKKNTERLAKLIKSDDSAVRYWASMGYLIRGKNGIRNGRGALIAALRDESPSVRIIAAEALGRYGRKAEARQAAEALMQYADPAKNGIALSMLALNALDLLGKHADPHREVIGKLARIDPKANPRMRNYANRLIDHILRDSK